MRCAAWAYRLVAVAAGFLAAAVYALEHAAVSYPDFDRYGVDLPTTTESVLTLVIAVAVPVVLIALHEIARRQGPQRSVARIGGVGLWTMAALFVGAGRWLGGSDAITSFDIAMTVTSTIVATGVLIVATGDPADLPYSPSTDG